MPYVPLHYLMNISIEKQLHNMHHLTAVSTDDLVNDIEHSTFCFYKYYQNARSSVASSITPTWIMSLLLCFRSKHQQNAQNMIIS